MATAGCSCVLDWITGPGTCAGAAEKKIVCDILYTHMYIHQKKIKLHLNFFSLHLIFFFFLKHVSVCVFISLKYLFIVRYQ